MPLAGLFAQPSSHDLRAKALRLRLKAGRSWSTERTKRLGRRAWNLEQAAALTERRERAERAAAYDRAVLAAEARERAALSADLGCIDHAQGPDGCACGAAACPGVA